MKPINTYKRMCIEKYAKNKTKYNAFIFHNKKLLRFLESCTYSCMNS